MVKAAVTEPQNDGEGRNIYTTYLVSTEKTAVRRRYSDFQWLYGRLQTELSGAIVPMIPHKRAISNTKKLDPDFIAGRLRNLQDFIVEVVEHPELSRAPSMTPFMLDKIGTEFDTGKKTVEAANPSIMRAEEEPTSAAGAAKKGLSNFIAKAKTITKVSTGSQELMQTPQEKEIEGIKSYVTDVEGHVKLLVKSAEALVKITADHSTLIHEMGAPVGAWKTTYQNSIKEKDEILEMMSAFCEFSLDYGTLMERKHQEEVDSFENGMQRLALDVKAFQLALKQRKQWQMAYTTKYQQIIDKEAAMAKAKQALKPPEVTDKLQDEKTELDNNAKVVKTKLEECTDRVLREAERTQPRLELAFKEALRGYAKLQMSYTNRINDAWSQLLPFVGDDNDDSDDKKPDMPSEAPATPPEETSPPPMGSADVSAEDNVPGEMIDEEGSFS